MSVTISTCNEICNAPTNHSSAKMLYTFSKQPRFLKRKTILYDMYYSVVKSSMNSKILFLIEELALDMVRNMISLRNYHKPLHLTLIITLRTKFQQKRKVLPLEKVERKWW